MNSLRTLCSILASTLLLAACDGRQDDSGAVPAVADADTGAMEGMAGMKRMQGMAGTDGMQGGMMAGMTQHMQSMHGAGADSMEAMLPMHRQMVANMIAQMNREMREMNMTGDGGWNATVDSLREDLKRMPEMTGAELQSLMPRHRDRVMRLMQMHGEMMAGMSM